MWDVWFHGQIVCFKIEYLSNINEIYSCYLRVDKGIEKAKQITIVSLPLAMIGTLHIIFQPQILKVNFVNGQLPPYLLFSGM